MTKRKKERWRRKKERKKDRDGKKKETKNERGGKRKKGIYVHFAINKEIKIRKIQNEEFKFEYVSR